MKISNAKPKIGKSISAVQFRTEFADTFIYMTLDEAARKSQIEITEVNESGSVNNLRIRNMSKEFVFLSDGDTLMGAKQNRTLNSSVLLEPSADIIIPVSCVEAGRWRYRSRNLTNSEFYSPSSLRREKQRDVLYSLKMKAGHRSDQGKVWSKVADFEAAYGSRSDTSDMLNIFRERSAMFEKELTDIFPENDMNGVAVFYGDNLASIEVFNGTMVYREYFPKLMRSAMLDRVFTSSVAQLKPDDAIEILNRELKKVSSMDLEKHKAVASGEEKRFTDEKISVYELDFEAVPIHFAALYNVEQKLDKVYVDQSGRIIVNFGEFKGRRFEELLMIDFELGLELAVDPEVPNELQRLMFDKITEFRRNRE